MTKEEKQTLLEKVVCEQLPYGVMVKNDVGTMCDNEKSVYTIWYHPHIGKCLPYLRPLSSMTEEEEAELSNILPCGMSFSYTTKGELIIYTDCEGDNDHYFICFVEVQDFLNAHHFDFRGLIPKGLAIAAVGENNPYKEKGGEE